VDKKSKSNTYSAQFSIAAPAQTGSVREQLQTSGGQNVMPASSAKSEEKSAEAEASYDDNFVRTFTDKVTPRIAEAAYNKALPKLIEALGIFVALFTFVSINIQIFSRITSINNAFIFVVLMFLCLSGFVYILHLFLTDQKCVWRFFLVILALGSTFILIFSFTADRAKLMIEENSEFTKIEKRIKSLEDKFEVHLQTRK
jgi:hypothetical protein